MKSISEALQWRYSTKSFDPNKKISEDDFATLKEILRMSPSSTNIQPWHYVIADDTEGKKRVASTTLEDYAFNESKINDASHVIVFCTRIHADDDFLEMILEKEDKDGRYAEEKFKQGTHGGRKMFLDLHRYNFMDEPHWLGRQVYLSIGALLLGAGMLGIDAVPMEGADLQKLDEEFDLRSKGYSALAVVALGYRTDDDFNADLPKSRLPEDFIFSKA